MFFYDSICGKVALYDFIGIVSYFDQQFWQKLFYEFYTQNWVDRLDRRDFNVFSLSKSITNYYVIKMLWQSLQRDILGPSTKYERTIEFCWKDVEKVVVMSLMTIFSIQRHLELNYNLIGLIGGSIFFVVLIRNCRNLSNFTWGRME